MGADDEAEAVVAIDCGGAHGGADNGNFGFGIDVAFAEHSDVAIKAGDAVRIDAAEIGGGEDVSGLLSVVFRDFEMEEDASAVFMERFDGEDFGLDGGHWWPFFGLSAAFQIDLRFDFSFARKHRPGICRRQGRVSLTREVGASWG